MKKQLGAAVTSLALIAILGASTVTASHVVPETTPGNYECSAAETTIDPVVSGTYPLVDGGSITITVHDTALGPTFDFTTSGATVSAIVVKGGPFYNTYSYAPPVESDTGLHSPLNAKNDKWYGLSHLCIASEKKEDGVTPK